ncbi:bifunctional pirin family protein/GNAT family N-acetyltransferase [Myceligenerans pegani]|nr:bifunctional pirin family protein/GNAT family N-acetyltransferase [Myceligenerans sp. TRM 65318]
MEVTSEAIRCGAQAGHTAGVEVLSARDVPLGGPRAMRVRRTIPQRARTLIGAWCFADHYGPVEVPATSGMDLPPHPHTGLQTVSWLFSGTIEHRDSLGTHSIVRAGELNLMTGGHGIAHSEVSTPDTRILHGVQLWVALPDADRDAGRDFQHHVPEPVRIDGAELRVFLGSLGGETSPVRTFTPLLGAQIDLEPHATVTLSVDPVFEHGLLVDAGDVSLDGTAVPPAELGYLAPGAGTLTLANRSDGPARAVLLGGPPFEEEIVMWWNFVVRDHEEILRAREDWENASDRFGTVEGYDGSRLPAPPVPDVVITPRRNPPRRTDRAAEEPAGTTAGDAANTTGNTTDDTARDTSETADPAVGDPVVRRVDAERLYEIVLDGVRVGLTAFRDRGGERIFHHTEVSKDVSGRGLASRLAEQALTDTRAAGRRIVPVCPYIARFIERHPEFSDAADPVTPELLRWLRSELGAPDRD